MIPVIAGQILAGALAGSITGLLLEVALPRFGGPSAAGLVVQADSTLLGVLAYLLATALFGLGFNLLVGRQRLGTGENALWGLTYGAVWWLLSALTVRPLLARGAADWSIATAQGEFPSFVFHLFLGVGTGLALGFVAPRPPSRGRGSRVRGPGVARGAVAGALAMVVLGATPGPWSLPLGLVAGAVFAVLYPRSLDGAGPTLVRGAGYGFLLWLVVALTIAPTASGAGPSWSVDQAREAFATFPGHLLAGSAIALWHRWLGQVWRVLFSDPASKDEQDEGVGVRSLRAAAQGGLAGLVGGLLFAVVRAQLGLLPAVAQLVGGRSAATGLVVHLVVAVLIGALYGLSFRQQTYDAASALGWGLTYGFFWWVLGGLTLLPVALGGEPQWTAAAVTAAFPTLMGHLVYGAAVGATLFVLEARSGPWWLTRTEVEARRVARRREGLKGAPAVWALVIVIALTIPIVLATPI